ncbi:lysine-specific demethylase 6B-like [Dicentrarchus labrax]|uniref:lysine-specific demethylase 6B-like n=1 Tax=Dicentrarchus labrax TaxID=13489 RepID=UPI0021F63DE6|nr:lysine-specific demethylase 6B-like [Dicentrarchus labrax]
MLLIICLFCAGTGAAVVGREQAGLRRPCRGLETSRRSVSVSGDEAAAARRRPALSSGGCMETDSPSSSSSSSHSSSPSSPPPPALPTPPTPPHPPNPLHPLRIRIRIRFIARVPGIPPLQCVQRSYLSGVSGVQHLQSFRNPTSSEFQGSFPCRQGSRVSSPVPPDLRTPCQFSSPPVQFGSQSQLSSVSGLPADSPARSC